MKKSINILNLVLFLCFNIAFSIAQKNQTQPVKKVTTETSSIQYQQRKVDENNVYNKTKTESLVTNTQLQQSLYQIDQKLQKSDSIQKATYKELTKDTFWEDIKRNLVASFIYDLLGFNGNTTGSIIAKILSLLYIFYLLLKARHFWKNKWKNKSYKVTGLDVFGGLLTFAQAAFSIFVFFASILFSNDDLIDKKAFNKANKNIQSLNKELESIKTVDFVTLTENL